MNRFKLYRPYTNYQLETLVEWQALPDEHKPLYTVAMETLLKQFKIGQSTESFVALDSFFKKRGVLMQNASGSTPTGGVPGEIWLRQSVAEKLIQATHILQTTQPHFALSITDGYRSLTLQRQHFALIMTQVKQQGYTGEDAYQRTTQFISDPDVFPPHSLGGTVDVTIYNQRTGRPIDMGTVIDSIEVPLIHSWCNQITEQQKRNRLLLYTAMAAVGFVNTPFEWWHHSYGDLEWALHTGKNQTLYSLVEQLDDNMIIQ